MLNVRSCLRWELRLRNPPQEGTTMTIQSQISAFIPRKYEIFAGLDVDKDGQIVLENYGSQPVRLGSVKRDDK